MKAGLNLYSIRNLIATEEDFLATARSLAEMGYSYIQYSGGPYDAAAIGRVSKETGLPVVLTHVPADRILNDAEALVAEHLGFGCKYIGLGSMDKTLVLSETECKNFIEKLERAAEKIESLGAKFSYHHHAFEFHRFPDGETVLGYMLKNTSHINFTVDTHWLQYGGADITDYLPRFKGRMHCVHLKDYRINDEFKPEFAPCGDGVLDMPKIARQMKSLGAEYFLVEQDNAAKLPDSLGQVKRSIDYLKGVEL